MVRRLLKELQILLNGQIKSLMRCNNTIMVDSFQYYYNTSLIIKSSNIIYPDNLRSIEYGMSKGTEVSALNDLKYKNLDF